MTVINTMAAILINPSLIFSFQMIGMIAIDTAEVPAAIVTIAEALENASVPALRIPPRLEKGIPALAAEAPVL